MMGILVIVLLAAVILPIYLRGGVRHHAWAHRRRSVGTGCSGVGFVFLALLGLVLIYRLSSVPHHLVGNALNLPSAANIRAEAARDWQEDAAIDYATTVHPAPVAKSRSKRSKEAAKTEHALSEAERAKVRQMISDAAAELGRDLQELKRSAFAIVGGGGAAVAEAAEPVKIAVVAEAEAQEPAQEIEAESPAKETPVAEANAQESSPIVSEPAETTPARSRFPGWMNEPTGLVGDTYYKTIVAGPHATRAGCDEALVTELNTATAQYLESYLGPGASQVIHLAPSFVRDKLVRNEYEETYDASFGPMKNLHVRLAFDKNVRSQLQRMHHDALSQKRMKEAALGAGGVLLVLGAIFSYLKLDTATRGYYTGRLRVGAAVVILAAGAVAINMVRHL